MNIGDRVEVITVKNLYNEHIQVGDTGTIIKFKDMLGTTFIGVEFDRDIMGHNCDGVGANGRCAILNKNHIRKILGGNLDAIK